MRDKVQRSAGACGARRGGRGAVAGMRAGGRRRDARPRAPHSRLEKAGEERMRPVRARAELRVELGTDHPHVILDLADLDESAVRRSAAGNQARLLELVAELVV